MTYRYVKKVKGQVAGSHVVTYNAGSRNLSFDIFDISIGIMCKSVFLVHRIENRIFSVYHVRTCYEPAAEKARY